MNERDDENLKTDESNSEIKEELLRRNEARALRWSLGDANDKQLVSEEIFEKWLA